MCPERPRLGFEAGCNDAALHGFRELFEGLEWSDVQNDGLGTTTGRKRSKSSQLEAKRAQRGGLPANTADQGADTGGIDIAYRPKFNTWRGETTIQLELKDLRPA